MARVASSRISCLRGAEAIGQITAQVFVVFISLEMELKYITVILFSFILSYSSTSGRYIFTAWANTEIFRPCLGD